ncbi:lysozyme inhibitor LprI family protein [Flavobacterium psychrotrophum]|uniref:lysozyme inhibitor LprI family protein n=1 Tax=Flavobacterium psychrotrophum TaxID=2294119 RepID=UPI000E31BA9A|nr:lysozyme inhibitor LprI family protein [Flavobacterium psychrotrophum]
MKNTLILFLLIPLWGFAQNEKENKHPIDIQFEDCKSGNTAEMIACANKEYDTWDKEMNKYYKLLMGVLGTEEKAKLKEAQRRWITYRDAEIEFAATLNRNKEGTMWPVFFGSTRASIVRTRALELIEYYEVETMN